MNINILFTGGITPELAAQFHTVCAEVARAKVSQVSVYIASRGGDVSSGLAMYNALKLLPCKVRTVNLGQCGSIAATLYMAGDVRQAMPASSFFLHAACYIEGPLKGQVSPTTALILAPFRGTLCWDKERLDCYFTSPDEKYLTPAEAADIGMVTDLAGPAPWKPGDLSVVLNPHGSEVPGMELFIARLHGAKKPVKARA
jgi:Clp protease